MRFISFSLLSSLIHSFSAPWLRGSKGKEKPINHRALLEILSHPSMFWTVGIQKKPHNGTGKTCKLHTYGTIADT